MPIWPYALDYTLLLALSIAFDVVLALVLLAIPLGRRSSPDDHRRDITLPRCLLVAVLIVIAWVPKSILVHLTVRIDMFGVMALLYFTAAIGAPIIGIYTLAIPRIRARTTRSARAFAIASLAAIPMFVWCSIIEPSRIVVERHTVPVAGCASPITIAVLADVQCTRITARERRIVEQVRALTPDLILMPGDLWSHAASLSHDWPVLEGDLRAGFAAFLHDLTTIASTVFCPGNCEVGYDWRPLFEDAGVTCVENQLARVTVHDHSLVIGGTELDWFTPDAQAAIAELDATPDDGSIGILLSHKPDAVLIDASDPEAFRPFSRVSLVVAGHTHGGQVRIPFLGPIITFSDVPDRIAVGGCFPIGPATRLCVSRGLGMERGQAPPIRFNCPPELTVLTIKAPGASP